MPSTHLSLRYHVVFSTKNRQLTIDPAWQHDLHGYLGGCVKTLDAIPEEIGGVGDHVHLLIGLRATHTVADVLREIKTASSKWIHEQAALPAFRWQEGYGAFTVSRSNIAFVRHYIATQAEHHRKRTFQEEYRDLLTPGTRSNSTNGSSGEVRHPSRGAMGCAFASGGGAPAALATG